MQQKLSCCDRYASDEVIMKVSKTKSVLINEGDYNVGKPDKKQVSGGRAAGWRPRASNSSQTPEGQNVKYQAPKGTGTMSISDLPGQYTGVPKSGGK
jgi:hypothetical protein